MARLEIIVRARSPLSLGTVKAYGGTVIESGDFVAGSHLRGALGALKNFVSPAEQAEIDELLGTPGQPGIRFPNCSVSNAAVAYPLPFTAQSCKRKSGFLGAGKTDKEYHGVADTLLIQLAYDRIAGADGQWHIPLPFQYKCPKCGYRTEPFTGVVEYRGPSHYARTNVSSHRQTRAAINRARLTAEEGQLYTVQAIDEGSLFVGVIEIDDARRVELVRKWLPRITRIGGRTSRGFGRVKVEVRDARWGESLWNRLESFNQKYREFEADLRAVAHDPPPPETRTLFTINLLSDALLRARDGLPTLRFDATMLREALDRLLTEEERSRYALDSFNFTLIAEYTQSRTVSGWQTAWQLPKEVGLASRRGGLYVFAAETPDDEKRREDLTSLLEKLEAAGIGEFREDGYGQIIVCHPFHLEVNPV